MKGWDEESDVPEEVSFEMLYDEALLAPITIIIRSTDRDKVETGVKNYKARLGKRMKEEGVILESNRLLFEVEPNEEDSNWINMTISTLKPASVRIKKILRSIDLTKE